MKKIAIALTASIAMALVMSACGSTQECPAYSQATTEVAPSAIA